MADMKGGRLIDIAKAHRALANGPTHGCACDGRGGAHCESRWACGPPQGFGLMMIGLPFDPTMTKTVFGFVLMASM